MKNSARPFWWPEEVSDGAGARAEIEACREWTPFLTALFDGEADEKEALIARRHLLVCERCARAWLDWNQTRHLLLLHAEPPAPPPNLLWRVALACRLARPTAPVPALSAQILGHTSRRAERPAPFPWWITRGLPLPGALALCAFALFLTRGAFSPSPAPSNSDANAPIGLTVNAPATPRARAVATEADLPILPSRVAPDEAAPRLATATPNASPPASSVDETLGRARRELEELLARALPVALPASDAPLPMLREAPRRQKLRVSRLARVVRNPRPVASLPRLEFPAVVLASVPASPSDSSPLPTARTPRVLLASLSEAQGRISAPRALTLTLTQPITSDDPGLDELDSTVQEYRATLVDAPDAGSDGR